MVSSDEEEWGTQELIIERSSLDKPSKNGTNATEEESSQIGIEDNITYYYFYSDE